MPEQTWKIIGHPTPEDVAKSLFSDQRYPLPFRVALNGEEHELCCRATVVHIQDDPWKRHWAYQLMVKRSFLRDGIEEEQVVAFISLDKPWRSKMVRWVKTKTPQTVVRW